MAAYLLNVHLGEYPENDDDYLEKIVM